MTGSPVALSDASARAAALDAALRRLHGGPDAAALSATHEAAAALLAEPGARRFHLTQAWVYAMVAGDAAAEARLQALLAAA